MHEQAFEWVRRHATTAAVSVLDIGGRDINGSPRHLYPNAARYVVLDNQPDRGVDIVADAATWTPDQRYEVVLCLEVFEHTPAWPDILHTAYRALVPGGILVLTMAGPGRPEHSAVDGGPALHPGEHYANIEPADLTIALHTAGYRDIYVDQRHDPQDVRAIAYR